MILSALVLLPLGGAIGAVAHRQERHRTVWLVTVVALHAGLVAWIWVDRPPPELGDWLALDDLGLLVLTVISALCTAVSLYVLGYLSEENPRGGRAFVSFLLVFLAAASLVAISAHLGLFWVAMETTTFSLVPLIYHRHDRPSLDAVWRYLLLSSVAIALALLGTFFLAAAQGPAGGRALLLPDLIAAGPTMQGALLRAAFVFLFVGYGTKMGVAPFHGWKPATYGEAPPLVGALMAGGLTSCAFLGIARVFRIATAAGIADTFRPVLIGFGLLSLLTAAVFMLSQRNFKRLLAYSSVEHMGLLLLGLGIGGVAAWGAALHLLGNGLAKGIAFLAVGNVALATGSADANRWHGVLRHMPRSGTLLFIALLALAGMPPSVLFLSEFTILSGTIRSGHPWVAATAVVALAVAFAAVMRLLLDVLHGSPTTVGGRLDRRAMVGAPLVLAVAVIALGLAWPGQLAPVLAAAAAALGGHAP